jgi:hypothetical protein
VKRIQRNSLTLGLLLLLAGGYIGGLALLSVLLGNDRLTGSLGILLGLYIASQPAANGLDLLLFMHAEEREAIAATRTGQLWLGLNLLTLLAGWAVIFAGSLRFVAAVK